MSNIKDIPMVMVVLLFFKVLGLVYRRTYTCMYGQLCDHGLPNFPQGMGATCVPALLNIGTQGM